MVAVYFISANVHEREAVMDSASYHEFAHACEICTSVFKLFRLGDSF